MLLIKLIKFIKNKNITKNILILFYIIQRKKALKSKRHTCIQYTLFGIHAVYILHICTK